MSTGIARASAVRLAPDSPVRLAPDLTASAKATAVRRPASAEATAVRRSLGAGGNVPRRRKVGPTPDSDLTASGSVPRKREVGPTGSSEVVSCYLCGSSEHRALLTAEDDLTGRPGRFRFVTCRACGLAYQNPRLTLEHVAGYYDDTYIAHRKRRDWGVLTPLFNRAMEKLDEEKERLVARYCPLTRATSVLDVGCGSGSFLQRLHQRRGVQATGLDFKDLSSSPFLEGIRFHQGLFYEVDLQPARFDVVTMWHFLEHDYDPLRSLRTARELLRPGGRLIVEVPRLDSRTFAWFGDRWPGLQAPQHTVLFDRAHLIAMTRAAGLEVIDYLPYGAFPAYFYLFTGTAFRLLRGRGLNLEKAMVPYFLGQLLLAPVLLFETHLNLAMQTVVCRRAE